MTTTVEQLRELYGEKSKHSQYQSIPDFISQALGYSETIDQDWRGDRARLAHIQATSPPQPGQAWADFGANTGFFTLSLAHANPQARFLAIEATPSHASFIALLAQHFGLDNVGVLNAAIGADDLARIGACDVLLHLNVLHHAGHDFDAGRVTGAGDFDAYAVDYLAALRTCARRLVFQVGSNLWGDKQRPLTVMEDDDARLAHQRRLLAQAGWRFADIAYAGRDASGAVRYDAMPAPLRALVDADAAGPLPAPVHDWLAARELQQFRGEFHRRPLVACE
jgi:hypothetical protein